MDPTRQQAQKLGLTGEELDGIIQILGRQPNFTELALYSVMWSEHCCYKNSILWLKTLPRDGELLLVKAGEENAGMVDIGDGYGCVFKIESHNHPSALEPFQGAATGVGGIHRDIFTMGARPVAALNSLRFGTLDQPRTRDLLAGVVAGIGHYGNCFGVPTVGGEVYFESCYATNPLVNALSAGIVRASQTVSAVARGVGNPVFIVGSDTGKDGIGGASFASADLTENSAEDLPAVQVGDPFQEKKLLEACLEIVPGGALIGMQDMGAAGIICSTAEMSAKGGHGMRIDLDQVPTRQPHMKAWEILLSESQERMLIVVRKGREEEVLRIFEKWDLHCVSIGEVTGDGRLKFFLGGALQADVPAESLVLGGGAPVYQRTFTRPANCSRCEAFRLEDVPEETDLLGAARRLTRLPNLASRRWICQQYDSMVGTANASTNAPSDASVILVKETGRAIALTTDCNGRYVWADPFQGAQIAVAEAARNIISAGAEPVAITNCLNFGNPYNPEAYYQFVQAVKGMGAACLKFRTPVTGGNVSFYNQSPDGPVYPTPVIGMLGLLGGPGHMTLDFKEAGDWIYLVGKSRNDLGCSEYLVRLRGVEFSPPPYFDLDEEYRVQQLVRTLIREGVVRSVHDVSDGGLFTCLLESAMPRGFGFGISTEPGLRRDAFLFGESQSRFVVSVPEAQRVHLESVLAGNSYMQLGKVTPGQILVDGEDFGPLGDWKEPYDTALERILEPDPS